MSKSDHLILIGPPNSGKTTLFNWITGYKRQTVNYPGSTVELSFGLIRKKYIPCSWRIVDTPGLYSFLSPSPEREVTKNILTDSIKNKELRGVILVLDATRLERHLPLVFQLKEMGLPVLVALSMYDIQKKESALDLSLLSKKLSIPVCPIEGLLGGGVSELLSKALEHFKHKSGEGESESEPLKHKSGEGLGEHHQAWKNLNPINILSSTWSKKKQESYLKWAKKTVSAVSLRKSKSKIGKRTQWFDSWFLHPVAGFGFLSLILFVFFSGIFWLAHPLMDLIDRGFSYGVESLLKWGGDNFFMDFLANGVLTSFGAFMVFVPQVFILFVGLHLLEDSGYLARAVTLVDGPFSRIGLSGRSLFPFLSGFACAIPATLSARSISSKRERWITIFALPFMTCSARLPVYALLLSFLFYGESAWKPGIVMSFIYFLSLLLGILSAGLLNLFFKKDKSSSAFFMELPLYRRPVLSNVLFSSYARTRHFIRKAGPVIVIFALVMWGATHFPRSSAEGVKVQVQKSYAGQFGKMIEPVFEQMGGDWRVGVSLLSAFVAREVFVSVLAVTLKNTQAGDFTENSEQAGMVRIMKEASFSDGRPLFSKAGCWALLVFFMFSLQCLSTTGIVYKETGSWKFAGAQLISLNVLAYIGAVLTYNIFSS